MRIDSIHNKSYGSSTESLSAKAEISKREAVLNSLTAVESNVNLFKQKAYKENYLNSGLCALIVSVPLSLWVNDSLNSTKYYNSKLKSIIPVSIVLSAAAWGYVTNKNSNNEVIAQKSAFYKTLNNELSKATSFVCLNDEQKQNLYNSDLYKNAKKKRLKSDSYQIIDKQNINPVSNMSKIKNEYLKDKNSLKIVDNIKAQEQSNYVSELCEKLDSIANMYEKKFTQGLNLMYASISALPLVFLSLADKTCKKGSKLLNVLSFALTTVSLFLIGNIINKPVNQNIYEISKYMAIKTLKNETNEDINNMSILKSLKFYLQNKNQLMHEMKQRAYLNKVENIYKSDFAFSKEQIDDAENLKDGFILAQENRLKSEVLEKNSLKRNLLKDFLLNVLSLPTILLIIPSLRHRKINYNGKNLMMALGIMLTASLSNVLLAENLYSDLKQ